MSKIDDLKNQFKLPICYNDKKHELSKTMVNDLELTKTINEGETPIYNSVFTPSHCFGEIMLESFSKYYTTDVDFLKDTQNMLKKNETNTNNKDFDPHDFKKSWTLGTKSKEKLVFAKSICTSTGNLVNF